jgi:hypothetical protein
VLATLSRTLRVLVTLVSTATLLLARLIFTLPMFASMLLTALPVFGALLLAFLMFARFMARLLILFFIFVHFASPGWSLFGKSMLNGNGRGLVPMVAIKSRQAVNGSRMGFLRNSPR